MLRPTPVVTAMADGRYWSPVLAVDRGGRQAGRAEAPPAVSACLGERLDRLFVCASKRAPARSLDRSASTCGGLPEPSAARGRVARTIDQKATPTHMHSNTSTSVGLRDALTVHMCIRATHLAHTSKQGPHRVSYWCFRSPCSRHRVLAESAYDAEHPQARGTCARCAIRSCFRHLQRRE